MTANWPWRCATAQHRRTAAPPAEPRRGRAGRRYRPTLAASTLCAYRREWCRAPGPLAQTLSWLSLPAFERFWLAAVDRLRGERHPCAVSLPCRDQQRRRRVQQHDIAERTLVSSSTARIWAAFRRIATDQISGSLAAAGILRRDVEGRDRATVECRQWLMVVVVSSSRPSAP